MNKIRVGNQTAYSAETPLLPFEYAVSSGFDAFEWFPDKGESGAGWDEEDIDRDTRSYIKRSAIEHDITLSVHGSLHDTFPLDEARAALFRSVEFAQDIGATLLNIHLFGDQGAESFIGAMEPVIRETDRAGIRLAIENTPLTGPEDFNLFFTLLKSKDHLPISHIGMCLDLGHANLHQSTQNNYLQFIDLLGPHVPIIHMHLHENFGDSDSHLTLFTGPAAANDSAIRAVFQRLKKRGYSGSIILEQWPDPPRMLDDARNRLLRIING